MKMKPKQPFLISPVKPAIRANSSRQFVAKRHNLALKKIKGNINGESSKLRMQRHKVVGNLNREVYECLEYLIEDEEIVLKNKAAENYIIIEPTKSLQNIDNIGKIECANGGQQEGKEEKCDEGQDVRHATREKDKVKLEDTPKHKSSDNTKHMLVDSAKHKLDGTSKLKLDYNTKVKLNDSVNPKLEVSTKYKSDDNLEQKIESTTKLKLDDSKCKLSDTPKYKLSDNLKQKLSNTLKHKSSDTSKRKLGSTIKRKLGDTPKQNPVKRKLGSASKRKLDGMPKHTLSDSAKHKLDNSDKHKLGNTPGYKFGYTLKRNLDNTPLLMLNDSAKHKVSDNAKRKLSDNAEIKLEDSTSLEEEELSAVKTLYQQLWDQATDIRLPTLLWSLHREIDGRFVAFVHLSEDSTSSNMTTDKMVMFEENCQPVIFLRGVKVLNLVNVPEELESLEQVAAILRKVDRLMLCEGMGVSNKESKFSADCQIYLDKVKDGLTCKACELEEKTSNIKIHKRKAVGL